MAMAMAMARPLKRQQSSSITPKKGRTVVPLQLTLRNIMVPLPFAYDDNQPTQRTVSRAQALVETMAQQSRLHTPLVAPHAHAQGLSALAPELPPRKVKSSGKSSISGCNGLIVCAGEVEAECLKEDGVSVDMSEQRSVRPKQVPWEDPGGPKDWRPGSASQKLRHKSVRVDRGQWARQEIERQQDRRYAQKTALRKKELRYFRRLEGVGRDIDEATNITSNPARDSQSIANIPIREDVEEQAGVHGYAKFLYRPGAPWRNVSSDSASFSSFGRNLNVPSEQSISTRPTTCETKKSTSEIVDSLSSANARRETIRKELAERLQYERARKKRILAQERAATKLQHLQCRCC
ncbi:hypothetical protein KC19_12G050900 [Ceratodon purpureus]|nr:hypothetical protein KC19_12G050900 [Ceratodon purpureus]